MALLEKHRSVIYRHLVEQVGEEAAEAMLAQFPSRDLDEPVTKEYVSMRTAELRAEIATQTTELRAEIATQTGQLRAELAAETGQLRAELAAETGQIRAEIATLRAELKDDIHRQTDRVLTRLQVEGAIAIILLAVVNAIVG